MAPVACRLQVLTRPFVKSFVFAWSENWKVVYTRGH